MIVTRLGITVTTKTTTLISDRGVGNACYQVAKAFAWKHYQATVKSALRGVHGGMRVAVARSKRTVRLAVKKGLRARLVT